MAWEDDIGRYIDELQENKRLGPEDYNYPDNDIIDDGYEDCDCDCDEDEEECEDCEDCECEEEYSAEDDMMNLMEGWWEEERMGEKIG